MNVTTKTSSSAKPAEIVSYTDQNYLIDLVKQKDGLRLAVLNGKGPTIENYVKNNSFWVVPTKDPFSVLGTGIKLPSSPKKYGSQEELVAKMIEFIHTYQDTAPEWEKLVAYYCLMTWVSDRFSAVPYLRYLDDYGAGKTRKLKVAHRLCYRGMYMGGASSSAAIFRLIEKYQGTLILDEADWGNSDMKAELVQILNLGYNSDGILYRAEKYHGTYEAKGYKVFGPKVIANRNRFVDEALESRCLTVQEPDRALRADIPRQLPPKFEIEADELRNQLLMWRFDNFRRITMDEDPLKHLDPRVCETGTAIYSITQDKEFREWFIDFLERTGAQGYNDRPKTRIARIFITLAKPGRKLFFHEIVTAYNDGEEDKTAWITGKGLSTYITGLDLNRTKKRETHGYRIIPSASEIEKIKAKYADII